MGGRKDKHKTKPWLAHCQHKKPRKFQDSRGHLNFEWKELLLKAFCVSWAWGIVCTPDKTLLNAIKFK